MMKNTSVFIFFFLFVNVPFLISTVKSENNKDACICVPYFQCTKEVGGEVLTDGKFLLDQRIDMYDDPCTGMFEVCCKVKKSGSKPRKQAPPYFISGVTKGCEFDGNIQSWAATLLFQKPDKKLPPIYRCGASIIHRDVVLTAAHCLEEEGYYFVRTGESTRKLYTVVMHPEFEMGSLRHDIAVLILRKTDDSVSKTDSKFDCIPHSVTVPTTTECVTATFNSDFHQLEKIYVPYVDPDTCTERLSRTRLGRFFELHESFLCAGGSEKDTCSGDGGNPLICPTPGQPGMYNHVGLVSWGIGCGVKNIPGVYVNISHVREWIRGVMKEYKKDV